MGTGNERTKTQNDLPTFTLLQLDIKRIQILLPFTGNCDHHDPQYLDYLYFELSLHVYSEVPQLLNKLWTN